MNQFIFQKDFGISTDLKLFSNNLKVFKNKFFKNFINLFNQRIFQEFFAQKFHFAIVSKIRIKFLTNLESRKKNIHNFILKDNF